MAAVSTEENGNQSSFKFEVCVAVEIGVGESYPYAFFFFKNRYPKIALVAKTVKRLPAVQETWV